MEAPNCAWPRLTHAGYEHAIFMFSFVHTERARFSRYSYDPLQAQVTCKNAISLFFTVNLCTT